MRLKDIVNIILHRATILFIKIRLALQFKFKLTKAYQPSPFGQRAQKSAGRECKNRFEQMDINLPKQ